MSRRKTHIKAGVPTGAVFSTFRARTQNGPNALFEAIGGGVGGLLGALTPDRLEPSSLGANHRSFCHSWSVFISGIAITDAVLTEWESFCRKKADAALARHLAIAPDRGFDRLMLQIQEMIWRITAGILAGFVGGYISHLVLDLGTPQSLPIVG